MVEFKQIHTKDNLYQSVASLMNSAFPPEERRSDEEQCRVTDEEPDFMMFALLYQDSFAGFITCWQGPGFVYVEHFATIPEARGKGLGTKVLSQLAARFSAPLVLEVEPPAEEMAARRIGFYRRNGFELWDKYTYIQPPYQAHCQPVNMHLMVKGHGLEQDRDFESVRKWLYKKIYRCETLG